MTDHILEWMKKNNVPLTRENYLEIAYMGDDPNLDAEAEAALPEEIRRWSRRKRTKRRQ